MSRRPAFAFALVLPLLVPATLRAQDAGAARVTLRASQAATAETPVVVALARPIPAGSYALRPKGEGRPIPAQVFEDGGKSYLAAVWKGPKGEASYTLRQAAATDGEGVAIRPSGGNLRVTIDGQTL